MILELVVVAAAHDIQVLVAIAVEVGEDGLHLLESGVLCYGRHLYGREPSPALVEVEAARLAPGAADEEIFLSVAVGIAYGQGRTHAGILMRKQGVGLKIVVVVFG